MLKIILFFLVAFVHFGVLACFGISWFGTTVIFYLILYKFSVFLLKVFKNKEKIFLIKKNLQSFLIFMLVIEFVFYAYSVAYTQRGIRRLFYFSEQKRTEQIQLLNFFAKNKFQDAHLLAYKPNSSRIVGRALYTYDHHYDKNGFRNQLKINDSIYKILILGDSFVEGDGSPNDSTITELMNKQFRKNHQSIRVYNAGVSGTNPIQQINLYHSKIEKLNLGEKYIVMSICYNDLNDIEMLDAKFRYLENISLIYLTFSRLNINTRNIIKLKSRIDDFRKELSNKNKQLFLVYFCNMEEVISNKPAYSYTKLGSFDIDFFTFFTTKLEGKKRIQREQFLSPFYQFNDSHFTPKGNKLLADSLSTYFMKRDSIW